MSEEKDTNSVPFYPDHIGLEAKVALVFGIILVGIGIFALFNPLGLQDPADPLNTPAHTKPEWYFLFLYQILKFEFVPPAVGSTAPVLGLLLIALWPFFDRRPDKSTRTIRARLIVSIIVVVVIIALTIWGEVS